MKWVLGTRAAGAVAAGWGVRRWPQHACRPAAALAKTLVTTNALSSALRGASQRLVGPPALLLVKALASGWRAHLHCCS
jgi:hypothetical protein